MSTELRIGDHEREAAVGALGEHYAAGRLSKDEYDERADAAWSARTRSALMTPFTDLPAPHPSSPEPTRTPETPPRARSRRGRWPTAPVSIAVIASLVVLAMADVIAWFVAGILIWLCWISAARSHGRRSSYGRRGGMCGWR